MATANPPWGLTWLLPIGVTGLVVSLRGAPLRWAGPLGYAFGLTYLLTLIAWMRVVGTDAWLLVSLVVALAYAGLGVGLALVTRLRLSPLWVACLWVGVETVLSAWPLGGFPWGRLVWATAETPFALWIPWVGSAGVTFLVALTGGTAAWAISRARTQPKWVAAGVIAVSLLVAFPLLSRPRSLTADWQRNLDSISVASVQGDVPGAGDQLVANFEQVTQSHARGHPGAGPSDSGRPVRGP